MLSCFTPFQVKSFAKEGLSKADALVFYACLGGFCWLCKGPSKQILSCFWLLPGVFWKVLLRKSMSFLEGLPGSVLGQICNVLQCFPYVGPSSGGPICGSFRDPFWKKIRAEMVVHVCSDLVPTFFTELWHVVGRFLRSERPGSCICCFVLFAGFGLGVVKSFR